MLNNRNSTQASQEVRVVVSLPDQQVDRRVQALRPYRVIIHDDPIHTYHEVALAVQRTVPGKSYADGWAIATLVDTTGQGIAAVCPKEHAEHYWDQFEHTYGLTSTIEVI